MSSKGKLWKVAAMITEIAIMIDEMIVAETVDQAMIEIAEVAVTMTEGEVPVLIIMIEIGVIVDIGQEIMTVMKVEVIILDVMNSDREIIMTITNRIDQQSEEN